MKVAEVCPRCATPADPNDNTVTVSTQGMDISLRPWRYCCSSCGWLWANALQRKHNDREFSQAVKNYNTRGWMW